jgi:hypothetical protein
VLAIKSCGCGAGATCGCAAEQPDPAMQQVVADFERREALLVPKGEILVART